MDLSYLRLTIRRRPKAVWLGAVAIIFVLAFVSGALSLALSDTEQLHIFPTNVASQNWERARNALTQELSEGAVLDDFSKQNAAYLAFADASGARGQQPAATSSTSSLRGAEEGAAQSPPFSAPRATSVPAAAATGSAATTSASLGSLMRRFTRALTLPQALIAHAQSAASSADDGAPDGAEDAQTSEPKGEAKAKDDEAKPAEEPPAGVEAASDGGFAEGSAPEATAALAATSTPESGGPPSADAATAGQAPTATSAPRQGQAASVQTATAQKPAAGADATSSVRATQSSSTGTSSSHEGAGTAATTSAATTTAALRALPDATSTETRASSTEPTHERDSEAAATSAAQEPPRQDASAASTHAPAASQEPDAAGEDVTICLVTGKTCHTLSFSGFAVDADPAGRQLRDVALRLSFAAKLADEAFTDDKVLVRYFVDGSWHLAGEIAVRRLWDNRTNGGHVRFQLPEISSTAQLEELKVQLEYVRSASVGAEVYVDAAWLDASYRPQGERDPLLDNDHVATELAAREESARPDVLRERTDSLITFTHETSGTSGLTMRLQKRRLHRPGPAVVRLSVTNTTEEPQPLSLNVFAPREHSVRWFRQWFHNVPKQTDEVVTGPSGTLCPGPWQASTTAPSRYYCPQTKRVKICDEVSADGTNCLVTDDVLAVTKQTVYESDWAPVPLERVRKRSGRGVMARLAAWFGGADRQRQVPDELIGRRADLPEELPPGQTLYFSFGVAHEPLAKGSLYVEAQSAGGSELAEVTWESDWQYRVPITFTGQSASSTRARIELTRAQAPHLFTHASSGPSAWRLMSKDHEREYAFEVLYADATRVELLATLPQHASGASRAAYLYYGRRNPAVGARERETAAGKRSRALAASGDLTYRLGAPEAAHEAGVRNRLVEAPRSARSLPAARLRFQYQSQRAALSEGFAPIVQAEEFTLERVELVHASGRDLTEEIVARKDAYNEWVLDLPMRPRMFPPGAYTLRTAVAEGDRTYFDEQTFYWGVLALNTHQSVYAPGATAELHLAALSESGNTVCDADLRLSITDPAGRSADVPVYRSAQCSGNTVVEAPDYTASYATNATGTYRMHLRRLNADGEVMYEITDEFLVQEQAPYVLERRGPTRIYPVAPYAMRLRVRSPSAFAGEVTEVLPAEFSVIDAGGARQRVEGDVRYLTWDVEVAPGELRELSYTFDAPDVSPLIYLLGPAEISGGESFTEARQWQIASDATGNMILLWDDGNYLPDGWTCVSCSQGDPFYQRFARASSSYGLTGGVATSTHSATGTVFAIGTADTENKAGADIAVSGHGHTYAPIVAATSTVPPYRNLRVIQSNTAGEPSSIPTGAIAIFDTTVPGDWTRYGAQDDTFMRGENTIGGTGGRQEHTHDLSGTTGAASGGTVASRGGGSATGANAGHTHDVNSTTGSVNNEPPYREVVLGKLNATATPPNGMLAMWSDEVPAGWIDVSNPGDDFDGRFLKASTTYGATGGTSTHGHADVTGITSTGESASSQARSGSTGAGPHTHQVDVTGFSTASHLPPYIDVVVGKRFSGEPVYEQSAYRWYANEDAEPPTDPWPAGGTDLAEDAPITAANHVSDGDALRLRLAAAVSNATSSANGDRFTLQYAKGDTCGPSLNWNDVGGIGSAEVWRGFNNASVSDGSTLSSTTLSITEVAQTYEEENNSASTSNDIVPGEDGEWDWVLQHNGAAAGATYCFRMIQSDGAPFTTYTSYPKLVTNRAPATTTLDTLFENEKTADQTPTFTFTTTDPEGEDIEYHIQVATATSFSAPVVNANSESSPTAFNNNSTPADKAPFNSGDEIAYTISSALTNNTTYWWRVRAKDPGGSDAWGPWSNARSFTVDTAVTISTWYQTTDAQFSTDALGGVATTGSDSVELAVGSTTGTLTSTRLDYDWGTGATAWGELAWNDTETNGDIKYHLEYLDDESTWVEIPDSDLSGNATGFDTSPVNLLTLDTTTYNEIRVRADFTDVSGTPTLADWTVAWGTRVAQPTLSSPFDNEKVSTTTPAFTFSTTDPQGDDLTYQVQWSEDATFATGVSTSTSDVDEGFSNVSSSTDDDPFLSGDTIRFVIQSADALTNNTTYWWRVRAKDPGGGDAYSAWSSARSITVDTSVVASTWYQTTTEQFETDTLLGTTGLNDQLHVATSVSEVLLAYGQGSQSTPRYRLWDGSAWGSEQSANDVGAPLNWVVTRAHPSAHEYALATLGTDGDVNVQIYESDAWGPVTEMTTQISNTSARGVDLAYETTSGDLMAVYCDGDSNPSYRVHDGTSWGSAGAITLGSTNDCEWIRLASDPTSDEIIMLSLDSGGTQYEAQVWNGSSWGNATTLGSMSESGHEGMALAYEASGDQALITTSNGNSPHMAWRAWNGSSWSAEATQNVSGYEWANLRPDDGTDTLVACFIDDDTHVESIRWDGASWTGGQQLDASAKSKSDRGVDCQFETEGSRDGNIMAAYSDTTNARYRVYNGATWSAESSISTITDSATVRLTRADDGAVLGLFFDDVNGQYDFSHWNGSAWSAVQTLETSPSVTASPFKEPFYMAARNSASQGTIESSAIDFDDGSGPRWERASWTDTEPGTSTALYSIEYFDTASSSWKLVPDGEIPGNAAGTSTSPIDLSGLDTTTYNQLRLTATLTCTQGNCPSIQDWTLSWAEGFDIFGTIKAYDQTTDVTSGTVAVAVNGSEQFGKTGSISGGSFTINNVNAFSGDVITLWVSGAAASERANAVTVYDGSGDVTGIEMYERHLSLGSDDAPSITNTNLGQYDNSVSGDSDIFFDVDGAGDLDTCVSAGCFDASLYLLAGTIFRPDSGGGGDVTTHNLDLYGEFDLDSNTAFIEGSWRNAGAFAADTSSVIFTATSSTESIDSTGAATSSFNTLTLGQATGSATWQLASSLAVDGTLTIAHGTLAQATSSIVLTSDLHIQTNGVFQSGNATTTFAGSGTHTWRDDTSPKQDLGKVLVDGSSQTLRLQSGAAAHDLTIASGDTFDVTANDYAFELSGSLFATGGLNPRQGTITFSATTTGQQIVLNGSSLYDATFSGAGGEWSFPSSNVTVSHDLTIATGTLTLAVGTTTVGGSFQNTGGSFSHNNGTLLFTSTNSGESVTAGGSDFSRLSFDGAGGSWSMTDTNATTSNGFRLAAGSVTLPGGILALGDDLAVAGGTLSHNNGSLRLTAATSASVTTNGNALYDVVAAGGGPYALSDTNLTIENDLLLPTGTTTLPGGVLALGGSLDASGGGAFDANDGSVRFNAGDAGHIVHTGGSLFSVVEFDGAAGGWSITADATSTGAWTLTALSSLTVSPGVTVEVQGTYSNAAGGAGTTWSGATLYLNSASAYTIGSKTDSVEAYDTLRLGANTDIRLWQASATTTTLESGASLYSQDHAGVDGDVYIYGDYVRSAGTDYWSAETDFDGSTLLGGNRRSVAVRLADMATATYSGATLEIVGTSTASTTIANQGSGSYDLVIDGGTLNASYFELRNAATDGMQLIGTSTITELAPGDLELSADGGTLLTVSAQTLNANPERQFSQMRFATSTGVASGFNVTALGAPSSFWRFSNHYGNFDGEANDSDPGGDPGNLRWDDSGFVIDVSGAVYASDATTTSSACDGSSPVVTLIVDGTTNYSAACNSSSGAYTISNVSFSGDVVFTIFIDDALGGEEGATITRSPSGDLTGVDVYERHVIARHEDVQAQTITQLALYDQNDDDDVPFIAATGSPDTLTLDADTALLVWQGDTFAPGGEVTLESGGSGASYDGTLILDTNATLTAAGSQTHAVGGGWEARNGSTFTPAQSTVRFTATTSGKSISPRSDFYDVEFAGPGGTWSIDRTTTVQNDMTVDAGEVSGGSSVIVEQGTVAGDGVLAMTGGTLTIETSGAFGGASDWTLNNLTLGDGTTGSTTKQGAGDTTVAGTLSIANNHTLNAGSNTWFFSGSGTVITNNGTFLAQTSTTTYQGTSDMTVAALTYYDLELAPAGAGSPTYTFAAGGQSTNRDLFIGDGAQALTVQVNTNDPLVTVAGDFTIASAATYSASNGNDLRIGGSYANNGTFTANGGPVLFNSTDTGETIAPGGSSFGSITLNSASGGWTITDHATTTGAFTLTNAASFTQASGTTLSVGADFVNSVGGGATNWSGTTLSLDSGGAFSVNGKSDSGDVYDALALAANTDVRAWNSSASSYAIADSASLYSQDHAGVDGELYIWGDYERALGTDHWSYATDFDGADLTGGSERKVDVFLADNATTTLLGGALNLIGTTTASTTVSSQGSGTYALLVSGGTFEADYYELRSMNADGLRFTGTPTVTDLSHGDFELSVEGGTLMTVAGGVITANPLKTFTQNRFATTSGVASGANVTATGASGSTWRFTSHYGNFDGEANDSDPQGDPGMISWDDSATDITVAGSVYQDEGSTVSGACDDSTPVVRMLVEGGSAASTTCASADGSYQFTNVVFNTDDAITVYLNDAPGGQQSASVTVDPITNIADLDLYEQRVVVRHEDSEAITIDDLSAYDKDQDGDIPFDADTGSPDTFTLDPEFKLIVWSGKEFAPGGDVTLQSGGSGAGYDGTLELQDNATLTAAGSPTYQIGGSWLTGSGAAFTAANSSVAFTATTSGKTIRPDTSSFYDLSFTGVGGAWALADAHATSSNDFTISTGTVSLPDGTLAVGGSFDNQGTFTSTTTSELRLTSNSAGETLRLSGSAINDVILAGSGGYTMPDANATSTGTITIASGSITLPSGRFAVGNSFINAGGSFTHAGELVVTSASAGEQITAGGSDFGDLTIAGSGSWSITDQSATTSGDLTMTNGALSAPSGTLAVGGSFTVTNAYNANAGTLRFFATTTGKTVNPGGSLLSDVVFDGAGGGWEVATSATSSNTWQLRQGAAYTQATGTTLVVEGDFTNLIGSGATDWTDATLSLVSESAYTINTKSAGGDTYATLNIGSSTDVRMWNSSASSQTSVDATGSLYSQDHAGVDGDLYIWGSYTRTSGSDTWSYASDFDGSSLAGSERQVRVRIASSSALLYSGGTLNVVGDAAASTTIERQGAAGFYAFELSGGTFNGQYYAVRHTDADGLNLSGAVSISELAPADFELDYDTGALITASAAVINQNPTATYDQMRFALGAAATGTNVTRTGTSSTSWFFTNEYGDLAGEDFDEDGADACGSIRWSDSTCLEVSQEHYRFRNDDGGEGAPADEWFDSDWDKRKRVRITNNVGSALTDQPVQFTVTHDADMESDFTDLRFTDESGTTTLSYWIENFAASATATVWVKVPDIPASDTTHIFMYYDNAFAADAQDGSAVFTFFDDFEDDSISEYSGDTNLFDTLAAFNYEGSFGVGAASGQESAKTTDGIYRTDTTFGQGSTVRFFTYVDAAQDDEPCALLGVQAPGTNHENYAVCLDQFPDEQVVIAKDVFANDEDGSATPLATTSVTYSTGWYEVEADWRTDNTIAVTVYDGAGAVFATTSVSDNTYTSAGGMGFTFWFQNGGWDIYTVRPYVATEPSVAIGLEQRNDGASWAASPDTAHQQDSQENFRLRLSVENSGAEISGQQFRLEYASKSGFGTCEAIPSGSFSAVPAQAGCGTSPICMTASTHIADQASTTQLLETSFLGTYTYGKIMEDPSNQSDGLTLVTNDFTELEYTMELTANASDARYCLRVTDAGDELDNYARIPEVIVNHVPEINDWTLNDEQNIELVEGATTTIMATATVSDLNGFGDIQYATSTYYRSGVTADCVADDNNCYLLASSSCPLTNCSGATCDLTCSADIFYFADPTDVGSPHATNTWLAEAFIIDGTGNVATSTSPAVELLTLRGIALADPDIDYGTLGVGDDTGAINASTTLQNTGNDNVDVNVQGTDMTASGSAIPVGNQKYADAPFTYSACAICTFLSGTSTQFELDLPKPTSSSTPITDVMYWGVAVPSDTAGLPHTGLNTFMAVDD